MGARIIIRKYSGHYQINRVLRIRRVKLIYRYTRIVVESYLCRITITHFDCLTTYFYL